MKHHFQGLMPLVVVITLQVENCLHVTILLTIFKGSDEREF